MFGVCNLSVVPGRAEPSDKSEMVTQLLFGESFQIIEIQKNWIQIKVSFDDYLCWIGDKQFEYITEEHFNYLKSAKTQLSLDLISLLSSTNSNNIIPLVLGSTLNLENSNQISINNTTYIFDGNFKQEAILEQRKGIVDTSFLYLNAPYLWGGRSPFGIDCSGFTQMVYKLNGYSLLRDASQQATQGVPLSFIEESEPGDLAFFDNEEGNIIHVGIIMENNYIIHASGKVRIDRIDHLGIYNAETNRHTHKLRVIKKII